MSSIFVNAAIAKEDFFLVKNETLSTREACLRSLVDYEKANKYSNIELSEAVKRYGFDDLERAFFTKLFYGVIEKKLTLDYFIDNICDKNTKIEPAILNILRMGLYQIIYMDKVPESAACDESVKLAKQVNPKNVKLGGFVNAILRAFIRNKDEQFKNINEIKDLCKHFEIKYSCSYDIIKTWIEDYGAEIAEGLLCASYENNHGLTISVNSLKISREAYFEKLLSHHEGLIAKKTERSPYGITIESDIPVTHIYGYNDGLFFVQDEASQICAKKTEAKPGDLVIDCCGAPGGKSFYMAQMMKNKGKIICFDLHKNKLGLVEKSAQRLSINIIETYEHDSSLKFCDFLADVVLCDVPCSGLGAISKKPEIKYKTLAEISKMPEIQSKILSCSSEYVKPGGTLVYSTCTLNKKENEEVTYKFLSEHDDFEISEIKTFFPFDKIDKIEQKTDGFFVAKMKRK